MRMTTATTAARLVLGIGLAGLALAGRAEAQSLGTVFYQDNNSYTANNYEKLCSVGGDGTGNTVLVNEARINGNARRLCVSNHLYTYQGLATRRWLEIATSPGDVQPDYGNGQLYVLVRDAAGNAVSTQVSNFTYAADGFAIGTPTTPASWSPDDSYVYFTVANYNVSPAQVSLTRFAAANFDLGIHATKDNVEYVTTFPEDGDFAISPDGGRLAYLNAGALVVLDLATQAARTVVSSGVQTPQWSPDGSRIAYNVQNVVQGKFGSTSYGCVYTVRPAVVGDTPVLVQKGGPTSKTDALSFGLVVWSPDSTALAFRVKSTNTKGTFYWIGKSPSAGGAVTQLTPAQSSTTTTGGPTPQAWLP